MRAIYSAPVAGRRVVTTLVLAFGLLLTALPAAAQTDEKLPAADAIIGKSIEAQGGRAALEKIHSRLTKGTIEIVNQGIKGTITSYEQAPNKQCAVVEFEGLGPMESGTDGTVSWEMNAMVGPRLLKGAEKALNERQARFNSQLYWKELYTKAECVAVEDVGERPCYKVVFTPKVGDPETVWYDRKTYMPVKSEFALDTPMGRVAVTISPTEFRAVDGIQLPHKVRQEIGNGLQVMEMAFSEVKHNVEIPAERFAVPEAVKALIEKEQASSQPTTK